MFTTSVALCTYNGARFLAEQLESILRQTTPPYEVILVDDHSTDDSVAIAEGYSTAFAQRGVTLSIVTNETNIGYVKNFEKALALCQGDVIFLSDQDDVWVPHKVESMLRWFAQDDRLDLLYSDAEIVDAELKPLGLRQTEILRVRSAEQEQLQIGAGFEVLLPRNLVTGATVAFRRRLFERTVPFPREWVHDEWLAVIAAAIGRIQFHPEPLIKYRQHASNQIGLKRRSLVERARGLFQARDDRVRGRLARMERLKHHLTKQGYSIDDAKRARLDEVLIHLRARAEYPSSRLRRIVPALHEWVTGRYHRYFNGSHVVALYALAHDLLATSKRS